MEFGEEDEQSRTVTIALDSPSSADDGARKDKFEEGENARMGQEEEEEGEREVWPGNIVGQKGNSLSDFSIISKKSPN